MGKLKAFQVYFADNRSVFYPGMMVSGQLLVHLDSPMEMTAIKIKFSGKAHVHWSESHGSGKNRTTRHYSASETLFEQSVFVHGDGGSQDRGSLRPGQHTFPFNFQLPQNLPSSFEGPHGYIRYSVKSTIVKPWKFNHNTKMAFTVLDVLDLNTLSGMLTPAAGRESKTLCCLCCKSAPIEVEFHLDRTGYVPGEWIIINATVNNGSNSNVVKTSAELMQTVAYHATSKTRTTPKSLNKIEGNGCGPHGTVTWTNERLHIPPLPPSESAHCRIIDITYSVLFTVHLRTFAINLRDDEKIIIGTVPLRSLGMYGEMPDNISPELPAFTSQTPTAPPISAADIGIAAAATTGYQGPPPSYAAATGDAVNIKDDDDNDYTMGNMSYTPQYTYYDWSQKAFSYN